MTPRITLLLLGLCGAAASVSAQTLSTDSPFVAAGMSGGPSAEAANPSDYEFVGVMGSGASLQYGFLRKSNQKSFWVSEGQEREGLKVLRRDGPGQVAVQQGGQSFSLVLRPPTAGRTAAPGPQFPAPGIAQAAVTPPRPPPLGTPAPMPPTTNADPVVAEKEREARMLVSDLLEIGMQQRKAYEEAQKRKAAEGGADAAKAPTPR